MDFSKEQDMAICSAEHTDFKGNDDEKARVRRDVFTTQEEAEERAKEIGLSLIHI